ncbi:MAG TPA: hypothetical protein VF610_00565, partial [Segetibacter sp.]
MKGRSFPFLQYPGSRKNRVYLYAAVIFGVGYFILLRFLYPIPSYYSDSFTWVGGAVTGQPVTFRPIGYSKLLIFFHFFSVSDVALIAAQYFCNLFANLFLFLTCTRFFRLNRLTTFVLFALLIVNPLYLFQSNYVSSDAFFNCFTVLWFTLLIWILHKPHWIFIIMQMVVLFGLFSLRYNAIFFPVIAALALCISRASLVKKIAGSAATFLLVIAIMIITTYVTKRFTGTRTFSAFSGWQMANNALHIVHNQKVNTAEIRDKEVKRLLEFTAHFFDTSKVAFKDTSANAFYMWDFNSPLKKYMNIVPYK